MGCMGPWAGYEAKETESEFWLSTVPVGMKLHAHVIAVLSVVCAW